MVVMVLFPFHFLLLFLSPYGKHAVFNFDLDVLFVESGHISLDMETVLSFNDVQFKQLYTVGSAY